MDWVPVVTPSLVGFSLSGGSIPFDRPGLGARTRCQDSVPVVKLSLVGFSFLGGSTPFDRRGSTQSLFDVA
jgi:hypothetical protein